MARDQKGKRWSYSTGERGTNRVRAFDRGSRGYFVEWWEAGATSASPRRKVRMALGRITPEAAKAEAEEIALRFRKAEPVKRDQFTLALLFDMYEREVTPGKGASKRAHDARCHEMFLRFLGSERDPKTLSRREWDRFIADRRAGRIAPGAPQKCGSPKPGKTLAESDAAMPATRSCQPVRDRVIAYDLRHLLAVLNWATMAGDGSGGTLIDRNPLKGLPMPKEESPRRPVLTSEQYTALRDKAAAIAPSFELLIVLAHETGHRVGSIRTLRWSDVDLDAKRIRWRQQNDKIGLEHVTPLTEEAVVLLTAQRKRLKAIGDAWIFPSQRRPDTPVSRNVVQKWWARAAARAELPVADRRGWHSLRRKFATEMKHTPLKDLAHLGGWKSEQTILSCYQYADEATQREALATRRSLTAEGVR